MGGGGGGGGGGRRSAGTAKERVYVFRFPVIGISVHMNHS